MTAEPPRTFARWLRTGVSSILEHGLFSITSLLTGVWVARDLGQAAYGIFAIAGGIVVLVVAVHHALVAEPMIVLASGKFSQRSDAYLRAITRGHVRMAPILALAIAGAGGLAHLADARALAEAILGVAVSLPPILLMTTMRRAASAELRAGRAAIGAAFYLATTASILTLLASSGQITIFTALATAGPASLVAAGIYALARPRENTTERVTVREVIAEHWRYGRAGIGAGILAWVPHNIYYFLLPALVATGLVDAATLRAAMNLISPVYQLNGALGIVLIPILASRQREAPLGARQIAPFVVSFLVVDVVIWLVLVVAGESLVELAYGGDYGATVAVLPYLAAAPIITGACTVFRAWAFAIDFPEAQLWSSLGYAGIAMTAIPFVASAPLHACALGMLAAACAYFVVITLAVWRRVKRITSA